MPMAEQLAASGAFDINETDLPRHAAAEGHRQGSIGTHQLPTVLCGRDFAAVDGQGLLGPNRFAENGDLLHIHAAVGCA